MDALRFAQTLDNTITSVNNDTTRLVMVFDGVLDNHFPDKEKLRALVLQASKLATKLNGNSFYSLPLILDTGA